MPGQAERVARILEMLSTGQTWNARALAAELGVSRRTIHRDFKVIRSRGFCISHDGETYRIDESRVNPPDEFSVATRRSPACSWTRYAMSGPWAL